MFTPLLTSCPLVFLSFGGIRRRKDCTRGFSRSPFPICSLGRLLFFSLLLTTTAVPSPLFAQPPVIVNISGDLTESQRRNIRSHLSLTRLQENEIPTEAIFNRLYGKARQEAAKALEPFGYYTPEITLAQQSKDGTRSIEMVVVTGPPVTVKEVEITLTGPGEQEGILREAAQHFPLHQGDVLDHQLYEGGKDKLIAIALESGYHHAAFRTSRVEISKKSLSATVRLQLDTGPRYLFGPLTFDADFIDHDLLRKISPVHEGDPFSPKALTRLRQSLFNADYFKTVDLEYDPAQATSFKVPVKVVLTPNLAHKYGIGLGYGTDTGARGTLEYTNRHINKLGHQLNVQLQPAQRKSNLGGTYTIPIGDPKKDRLALAGKYETEEFDNTDTETVNATVSHDHFREWGEYSTYLQFLDEQYSIGSNTDHASLVIPGLKGSVFWADDRITTKRGIRFTATAIGSEENVLADTTFLQTSLRTKAIYTPFDQWRVLGRAEIGTTLVDDIYDLPPTLRYYAGGDQSVRGYGYKKIGPVDSEGNVVGGKNLLTYSVELERSLFEEWSGALFYDSGTAMNTFSNITLHSGAGIGVRWSGVFGQIRLDLAKALDEEGSWRIHFTMGADL
ncbi:outer membrane protein assembly factor [uncultured Desulfobulbus sp.]|uniref:autotransporter assembly complex protein TamA n=1 Tax=uncultured Desulfobulbus sp. TaxID=239745 RepID=UPI0029C71FF6|nr:outer membrane protein assembly factor [uncultured Desulfobulbus sp.]